MAGPAAMAVRGSFRANSPASPTWKHGAVSGDVTPRRYRRSQRVLWRVVPGMVLTQRIDDDRGSGAAELTGLAAQVWVVLDEPADAVDIREALGLDGDTADRPLLEEALEQLLQAGLIDRCEV